VLVENALFATLDPTTRRPRPRTAGVYTLSDTVGFVRHLPHHIVEAFRSTLEEVAYADLVVHVVDGAHATRRVRSRGPRGARRGGRRPDPRAARDQQDRRGDEETLLRLKRTWPDAVFVSARSGSASTSCTRDRDRLPRPAVDLRVLLPYDRGDLVARIHRAGRCSRPGTPRRAPSCRSGSDEQTRRRA
jgi:GTP-binding protein HflX